ncbi:hypothetical protein K449DRAFT_253972 [Hypoxylon sp. EC38]|nr:hypothetical protein K449DRAFT_253972 [Hypoxylon sp. EC38]
MGIIPRTSNCYRNTQGLLRFSRSDYCVVTLKRYGQQNYYVVYVMYRVYRDIAHLSIHMYVPILFYTGFKG